MYENYEYIWDHELFWRQNDPVISLIEAERCIYGLKNYSIIVSDNGLSPIQHQASISASAEILSIEPMQTNLSEVLVKIHTIEI